MEAVEVVPSTEAIWTTVEVATGSVQFVWPQTTSIVPVAAETAVEEPINTVPVELIMNLMIPAVCKLKPATCRLPEPVALTKVIPVLLDLVVKIPVATWKLFVPVAFVNVMPVEETAVERLMVVPVAFVNRNWGMVEVL
jgi:hypothetical protein